MKKVLLINPPRNHYPNFNQFIIGLPLGLMSLAAYLQRYSISVSILDCLIDSFEAQQKDGYITYGMPFKELKRRASKADPDIIGITFPFSTQYDLCLETVKIIKQALPHVPIIVGGPHVTVAADELLNASSEIDVCVISEGEITLYELVDSYSTKTQTFTSLDKIKGIVYRDANGELKCTKPREYIVSSRDRCDETEDRIRSIRKGNFKYIRNFHYQRPYLQPCVYKDYKEIIKRLRKLYSQGNLDGTQSLILAESRPQEELYDLSTDSFEINNLSNDPSLKTVLEELRAMLNQWVSETDDKGQYAEPWEDYMNNMRATKLLKYRDPPQKADDRERNMELMQKWRSEGK